MIHEFHKQKDIRGLVEMELNRFSLDRELHVLRFGAHNNREDKVAQESGPSEWYLHQGQLVFFGVLCRKPRVETQH